jgi:hypothetical protein
VASRSVAESDEVGCPEPAAVVDRKIKYRIVVENSLSLETEIFIKACQKAGVL